MLFVLIGFVAVFAIAVISFSIINHNLQYEMPVIANIELYDNSGEKYLSVCNNKKQSYVTLDKISLPILQAFVTVEDKRFFEHPGVDFIRIAGALLANIRDREFSQGASTITQQYIKNVFLSHEKTVKRKLYEAMIAINFENKYSKEEILEGYLNTIYFDHGIYGIEDASLFYFNKHASEINLIEACALASIPKSPGHYSPLKNPVQNKTRRNLILNELLEEQVISEEEYLSCYDQDISVVGINQNTESVNAPYFQDLVLRELQKMPWLNDYAYKGLKVYTTLDRRLNTVIQQSLKKPLARFRYRGRDLRHESQKRPCPECYRGERLSEKQLQPGNRQRQAAGFGHQTFFVFNRFGKRLYPKHDLLKRTDDLLP